MLQFPIPRPRSDDGTLVPAALAGVLLATLAGQFMLVGSDAPNLAASKPAATRLRSSAPPVIPAAVALPVIEQRPIFAPGRVRGGGAASGGDPLAGATLSGSWSVGGRTNLVLRQADGTSRTLRVGQSVNSWVLASVTPQGARFWRDGKTMLVPFGASAPPGGAAGDTQTGEETP